MLRWSGWGPLVGLREEIGVEGVVWGLLARLREEIGGVFPTVPVFWVPCSVIPHLMGVNRTSLQQKGPSGAHKAKLSPNAPMPFFLNSTIYWGNTKCLDFVKR